MPVPLSATVTPLAQLSPIGKLRVDVVGLLVGSGVSATKPALVWFVTVRLPVTANVRATGLMKAPLRPVPLRVSSNRAGLSRISGISPELITESPQV